MTASSASTATAAFRAAVVDAPAELDDAALDAALATAHAAGRAAWPDVAVDPARFAEHLATRCAGPVAVDPFARLAVADLYLACACADRDARALAICDDVLRREAVIAADAAHLDAALRDEAVQIVRAAAFAPRVEKPAAICDYAGRGALRAWLRVMVSRELVRLARTRARHVELEDELAAATCDDDPVFAELKQHYRAELADAFRASLGELQPRDRTLLRYQLIDGLTIDDIAAIYRVHRATAARWLVAIRDKLVDDTRARLAAKLGVDTVEAASIVRLVQSQLDVSVIRHLT